LNHQSGLSGYQGSRAGRFEMKSFQLEIDLALIVEDLVVDLKAPASIFLKVLLHDVFSAHFGLRIS